MKFFGTQVTAAVGAKSIANLIDDANSVPEGTTTYVGFKGTLKAPSANASDLVVVFGGNTVHLAAGDVFEVDACDLANVTVSGNGDILKLVGVTADGWGFK